jgi:hypothetical protein
MIEWPHAGGMVEAGDHVRDRKHPVGTGTVLGVRDVPAREYHVDAIGKTVAADNPAYPGSDPVVELVWAERSDAADLAVVRDAHTVYHFPISRLVCETCVRDVSPDDLSTSPYHHRSFAIDENWNRGYIRKIHSQGYINSLLVARETGTGLELVAGNKRRWVAQQAGLETVAARLVDVDEWEAAVHYAGDHLSNLTDEETARQTVSALVDRWGERALSVPSVASTIERLEFAGEVADRDDSLPGAATASE